MPYISYCCYLITKTFISYQYYLLLYLDDDRCKKEKITRTKRISHQQHMAVKCLSFQLHSLWYC